MIEVLKQALKAFRKAMQGNLAFDEAMEAFKKIEQAIAELESQEPVVTKNEKGLTLHIGWNDLPVSTKLFTHPPQRTWVELTLDEIAVLHANYPNPQGFALALQAKLKEKNNA